MMVKRKLDGAVDKSSVIEKFKNPMQLYINCEKFGGLYLAEPGLMAGWLAGEIWVRLEILKACCRLKYSIFRFV